MSVSHENLRVAAVRWLTRTRKCSVVLSELTSAAFETPDAIGWKSGISCLVECKTSRSDFLANARKPCILGERAVGEFRYFLCIPELITLSDLTDSNYGLLWLKEDGRIRLIKEAVFCGTNHHAEILMLTSALRRVKTREFLTINLAVEDGA